MIDFSIVGDMNRAEIILLLKKLAYHDKEDEFKNLANFLNASHKYIIKELIEKDTYASTEILPGNYMEYIKQLKSN